MVEGDIRIIPDLLRLRAREVGDRTAHVDDRRSLTFREWDEGADAVAGGLVGAGVAQGDRVLLPISNEMATTMAVVTSGVHRASAVAVPVNVRWTPTELTEVARMVGAKWGVSSDPALLDGLSLSGAWACDDLPTASGGRSGGDDPREPGICDILLTSGTTGRAKGVVTWHRQLIPQLAGKIGPTRCVLHALPVTSYGGHHGYLFQPLRDGATVVTMGSFSADGFLSLIEAHRPETFMAVPAMLALIARSPRLRRIEGSSVQTIRTGTAPLHASTARIITKCFPRANLLNLYGSTEAGSGSGWVLAVLGPGAEDRLRSLNQGKRVEVRDGAGRALPHGVEGDVWLGVASPRSYWEDPVATAATWKDGWVRTGDRGVLSEDGRLALIGRGSDMIIRGGYNIAPLEIEEALHDHPHVLEAAVVAVPHDVLGEDAVAVIRASEPVEDQELASWLRERLADYKVPRRYRRTEEPLPRNAMGKLDRRALAQQVLGR